MSISHRKDIDGLRSVAVLPVLFFHANIWPFSSGYVGVDIFFVISGYLISGLILREAENETFSIIDFYDRRARRILPALFVVLSIVTLIAIVTFMPSELVLFGKSLLSSVLFVSNIYYWYSFTDYFNPGSSSNPLLHVWSLSVEEQFYVFWPLLLVIAIRARLRPYLATIIVALAAISLSMAYFTYARAPMMAFFFLHTRAWELLAGAFLASLKRTRNTPNHMLGAFGFALVCFGLISPSTGDPFPSWNAIAATAGTALILFCGEGGSSPINSMLSMRGLAFIGRISYSLYLWHWPLLALPSIVLNRDLTLTERLMSLAFAGLFATLSYYFIEQPIRKRKSNIWKMPASLPIATTATLIFCALSGIIIFSDGLASRLPAAARTLVSDADLSDPPDAFRKCLTTDDIAPDFRGRSCIFGPTKAAQESVIWGDSFSAALAPGLVGFASEQGMALRVVSKAGCLPLPGILVRGHNGLPDIDCMQRNDLILHEILSDHRIKMVILHALWQHVAQHPMVDLNGAELPTQVAQGKFAASLSHLVKTLTERGIAVLIIGRVPSFSVAPLHCIGRNIILHYELKRCDPMEEVANIWTRFVDETIRQIAAQQELARAIFPASLLCNDGLCDTVRNGRLLYIDRGHITHFGAAIIGSFIRRSLHDN